MNTGHGRRGMTLALVVMVMALVGGLISLLAWNSAHFHQQRQVEQARLICAQIARSAASYVQIHARELAVRSATEPVELNVTDMVPFPLAGKASLQVTASGQAKSCHVIAVVEGTYGTRRELDVPLPASGADVNNSQPATQP